MIDTASERYIDDLFLANCTNFGGQPSFVGNFDLLGFREAASRQDVEKFKQRLDARGKGLRRRQKGNQDYLYGRVFSFKPQINFRLAEYAAANKEEGFARIDQEIRRAKAMAFVSTCMQGGEVGFGAGGKQLKPAFTFGFSATHPTTHDGNPGWHNHEFLNGIGVTKDKEGRPLRNKELY